MTAPVADRAAFDPVRAVADHYGHLVADRRYLSTADVVAADDEGVVTLLAEAERRDLVVATGDPATMLRALSRRATGQAVALEACAVATVELLAGAGIETRALKGVAVSHLDYPSPELRAFGDIDVLVRGADVGSAVELLRTAGFERHFAEPWAGFDATVGKGVAVEDTTRTVIDLHRTLALGAYGTRLPLDALWASSDPFPLGGAEWHALGAAERFVHGALHMALTPDVRLLDAVDLATIATVNAATCSAANIIGVAETWRCRGVVAQAVRQSFDRLGASWAPPGLEDWALTQRPSWTDRLADSAFHGPLAGTTMRSLTAVAGLPSWTSKAQAARGALRRRGRDGRGRDG